MGTWHKIPTSLYLVVGKYLAIRRIEQDARFGGPHPRVGDGISYTLYVIVQNTFMGMKAQHNHARREHQQDKQVSIFCYTEY